MTNIEMTPNAFVADLRRAYRAEYEGSKSLKSEFLSADDYAAYMVAENPAMIQRMRENYEDTMNEAARQRALRAGLLHARH